MSTKRVLISGVFILIVCVATYYLLFHDTDKEEPKEVYLLENCQRNIYDITYITNISLFNSENCFIMSNETDENHVILNSQLERQTSCGNTRCAYCYRSDEMQYFCDEEYCISVTKNGVFTMLKRYETIDE